MRALEQRIDKLQETIDGQKRGIAQLRQRIESLSSDISRLEDGISQLEGKIAALNRNIAHFNEVLHSLRRSLAQAKDEKEKARLEDLIASVEREQQSCIRQRNELEKRRDDMKQELASKQALRREAQCELDRLEASLRENERTLSRLGDKCERLKAAHAAVVSGSAHAAHRHEEVPPR